MLNFYRSNSAARSWIENCLIGDGSLDRNPVMCVASAMRQSLPLQGGEACTLVEYPWKGDMDELAFGAQRESAHVLATLAEWIEQFVRLDPANICLIDEPLATPSDPAAKSRLGLFREAVLYCNGSIFYRIGRSSLTRERIAELLALTYRHSFCCVLTSCVNCRLSGHSVQHIVSLEDINEAVVKCQGVFVSAYDEEGLALWTRKNLPNVFANPWEIGK